MEQETPMDDDGLDLPLMSNIEDIEVYHFILDLTCHFQSKQFGGSITLFCRPAAKTGGNDQQASHTEDEGPTVGSGTAEQRTEPSPTQVCHWLTSPDEDEVSSDNDSRLDNVTSTASSQNDGNVSCLDTDCQSLVKQTSSHKHHCTVNADNSPKVTHKSHCHDENQKHSGKNRLTETGYDSLASSNFKMVLDCWDLHVESVEEIVISEDMEGVFKDGNHSTAVKLEDYMRCCQCSGTPLRYGVEKKCLRIWKEGSHSAEGFPRIVRIQYRTSSSGQSLKWTLDQDGHQCVFTHGHWINNRSLFPGQDVPVAMATWQANIHTEPGQVVIMSGDKNPSVSREKEGLVTYCFHTEMLMPVSTLALAVGAWQVVDIIPECSQPPAPCQDGDGQHGDLLPCRLITPLALKEPAMNTLGSYIPTCMKIVARLLGPHPFQRLDVLLVPRSFCSLGMASPSLMFLSQSVLSRDRMMCMRLAHEMSHSWFGLLIGPRDWTEEWLSEGFCTYTEGYIHDLVMGWSDRGAQEQAEIRDYVRYKTLKAELQTADDSLLTLRPNPGVDCLVQGDVKYVKNGMNPDKGFMQIHYLKGYFLLKNLEELVGRDNFHCFLKTVVKKFYGQLISSQDFLSLYFQEFPHLEQEGITQQQINSDWLDTSKIPQVIHSHSVITPGNKLAQVVFEQAEEIRQVNQTYRNLHWRKRRKLDLKSCLHLEKIEESAQILLLLEELLKEEKVHPDILNFLQERLHLCSSNADILHRWCELVIKNKCQAHYDAVRSFLTDHQAMGVYLFGELILSADKQLRHLAETCFTSLADDMEDGVLRVVRQMVYGN